MWSERHIFWASCVYRLLNCWLVQTSFVPDEYWQSLEPAYRLVFGFGDLSWEWKEGLRSYIYPLFFAALYKVLAFLRLDTRFLIVYLPRLAQSLLAVLGDVYLYKFAKKLYGEKAALWTLICYWLNWFTFFCAPRTLANTVEAQLTIIALYCYPWPANYLFESTKRSTTPPSIYMTIVALATIIRPTSAVFWLPLCVWHLFRSRRPLVFIFRTVLPATLPVLLLSLVIDRLCYGDMVFTLWRFLEFNVLRGGSAHFGVHPWHWYFTNCLPSICLTHSILVVYGIRETKDRTMFGLCGFYILIHSFLAHKELRFLLPLLAPLCTYAGRYIEITFQRYSLLTPDDKNNQRRNYGRNLSIETYIRWSPKRVYALIGFLFVTNLPVMIYTGLFHQRGILDVAEFLHHEYQSAKVDHGTNRTIGAWFLSPCYTNPGYSHIHAPINLRMLDCTPNLKGLQNYVEEADDFHADPTGWIDREFSMHSAWPTHVIKYDWMWTKILRQKLQDYGYKLCARFYHTDFPQSERQSKYFVVACLN